MAAAAAVGVAAGRLISVLGQPVLLVEQRLEQVLGRELLVAARSAMDCAACTACLARSE